MIDRRRMLMLGAATAGALAAGCARGTVLADPAEPLPPIGERIGALERRHNATVGLYATNLVSGKTVTHRDSQPQAICSTFKGYLAARVLQMTQTGQLSLQKALFVDRAAILPNSPFTEKRVNLTMTIEELCQAVLQQSDNAAANMLLREIGGPPAITAFARSIGDETTRLDRWEIELNTAIPGDPRDTSTPRALADGYRAILTGDVLASDTRALLDEWMRANQTSSMRAGLPPGWTSALPRARRRRGRAAPRS